MMFRAVFWVILPCKMIVDRRFRGASSGMSRSTIILHGSITQKTALNIILHMLRQTSPSCFPPCPFRLFSPLTVTFPKLSVILRPLYTYRHYALCHNTYRGEDIYLIINVCVRSACGDYVMHKFQSNVTTPATDVKKETK
jgi:hypothetical protein